MKIPENQKPYRVIINGVEKVYEAGAEVDVDAATAAIIKNADAFPPAPATPVPPIVIPEPSGGTEPLAVEMVMDATTGTVTLQAAAADIYSAYPNVYAHTGLGGVEGYFPLLFASAMDGTYSFGISLSSSGSYMITALNAASGDDYPSGSLN
jgi:hypothetical protein